MRMLLSLAIVAAAAASARAQDSATARPQTPASANFPVDRVVAVVGTQPILWSQVQERVQFLVAEGARVPPEGPQREAFIRQTLETLVNEELLTQRARVEKIEVTDAELAPRVEEDVRKIRSQFKEEGEFRQALRQTGFGSPEEYRRWITDESRRRAMQQKLFEKLRQEGKIPLAPVSETDIDTFFVNNRGSLPKVPATVSFRQIAVRPQPTADARRAVRARADSLYQELKRGEDFETVAKRESMDPATKELGGDLGWLRRGSVVPQFDRVMWSLTPGEVSTPFETQYGIHIVRVDRVQPAEVKVRHILLRPRIDSADIARARATADSVARVWRAGANFDSLYKQFEDRDEERSLQDFPRARLPQAYQDALKDKAVNDITDPFPLDDPTRGVPKFLVLQITGLTEEHDPAPGDWRQEIRSQLQQQGGTRRFLNSLRKQTHVEIRL